MKISRSMKTKLPPLSFQKRRCWGACRNVCRSATAWCCSLKLFSVKLNVVAQPVGLLKLNPPVNHVNFSSWTFNRLQKILQHIYLILMRSHMFEIIVRTKVLIKLLRNQPSDRIRGLLYQGGSLGPWVQFAKNISYQLDWLFWTYALF